MSWKPDKKYDVTFSEWQDDPIGYLNAQQIPDNPALRNLGFDVLKDFLVKFLGVELSGNETLFGLVMFAVEHQADIIEDITALEKLIGGYVYCSEGSNNLRRLIVEDFFNEEGMLKNLRTYLVALMNIRHAVTGASNGLGIESIQRAKIIRAHVSQWEWTVGEYQYHRESLLDNFGPDQFESAVEPYHKDILEILKTTTKTLRSYRMTRASKDVWVEKALFNPDLYIPDLDISFGNHTNKLFSTPRSSDKPNPLWALANQKLLETKKDIEQKKNLLLKQLGPDWKDSQAIKDLAGMTAEKLVELDHQLYATLSIPEQALPRKKSFTVEDELRLLKEFGDMKIKSTPEHVREFRGILGHFHNVPIIREPRITSKDDPFVGMIWPSDKDK